MGLRLICTLKVLDRKPNREQRILDFMCNPLGCQAFFQRRFQIRCHSIEGTCQSADLISALNSDSVIEVAQCNLSCSCCQLLNQVCRLKSDYVTHKVYENQYNSTGDKQNKHQLSPRFDHIPVRIRNDKFCGGIDI